ncbi:universal stress protein [Falsiroseomonas bella]|uniref:Universal stress protein n=1 Tax=Falsiroseomonas bella TaxID=2184016 RepID=A0A317FJG3_9PROT|nr:universal stress protein [Falsiroseomonas bella]PWS39191.1 universal stress protein [Falsiroseomonas bella]
MAIRDILVHLDATPRAAARLDLAAQLAQRLQAHLTGLFVLDIPIPAFAGGEIAGAAAVADLIEGMRAAGLEDAAKVEATFREKLRREGLAGEWRLAEGITGGELALHGRYADLVVVGQSGPEDATVGSAAIEAALFQTGRPVLVVPHAGPVASLGKRVLVGWNASREASRALHDALPLIATAESVTVLTINAEPGADSHGEEPGADIARHLARHGLQVTVRRIVGAEISAGDMLLNEAADLGADLLVMGGYGHSRFREFMLGGATRTLLGQMTVPVLMSH